MKIGDLVDREIGNLKNVSVGLTLIDTCIFLA
jgi:hypothetical protein